MEAPKYQAPPEDPQIAITRQRAEQDNATALQNTAAIDTASLMARYGTRLAMAGSTTGSPLVAAPAVGRY